MASLTEEQKSYVVKCLACRLGYAETARRVQDEYGIQITRGHVRNYNPDPLRNAAAGDVSPKWRAVYAETRTAYDAQLRDIGITSATRRAEIWDDLLQRAINKGHLTLAVEILGKLEELYGDAKRRASTDDVAGESLPDLDEDPVAYMERAIGSDLAHVTTPSGPFGRRS